MTYQLGETVRFTATITDSDGAAADPSTTLITIEKPDGTTAVDGTAMTKSETGSYYYDYTLTSDATGQVGAYHYKVECTGSGGRITIKRSSFYAEVSV
jgi:uncharacterized protein YfaS (alpha-2-macroglobulin family)